MITQKDFIISWKIPLTKCSIVVRKNLKYFDDALFSSFLFTA